MNEHEDRTASNATSSGVSRRAVVAGAGFAGAATLAAIRFSGGTSAQSTQIPATPVALGPTIPPEIANAPDDWPIENKDLAQTRNATGSNISSSTVSKLDVAWTFPLDVTTGYGSITSNPVVSGDVIYIQDQLSNFYAIDKATGKQIWKNEYNVGAEGPNGVTIGYGLVVGALGDDSVVVAVDAATGKERWRVDLSANVGEGIDIAPLIYDNTVYVSTVPGNSNGFYRGGEKGIFYALEIGTGNVIWQWDTTENLWGNVRENSGGGLWHPPAVDENGELYLGVANPAPWPGNDEYPNGSSRPGANLYSNSIVKFDPEKGAVVWYDQIIPHDLFDLDQQLSPVLTTVKIGGTDTPIVVASGKHGYVVGIDRSSGTELYRTPIGIHENDLLKEIPEGETIEEYPSSLGGVETPFAVANGVGFFATANNARYYTSTGKSTTEEAPPINEATGNIVAVDLTNGQIIWNNQVPTAPYFGATVVNDIVFTGGLDGVIHAWAVKDGKEVWKWQAPAGLNATPAIVGDYFIVPAGTALLSSVDTASPVPAHTSGIIALKLGS